MTDRTERALRQALADSARSLLAARLNCGSAGNVSARSGGGMLITPSGLHPDQLTPADIIRVSFDGQSQGPHAPSSEWQLHRDLYLGRPDASAVVHTHSPFATALACQRRAIPAFHYTVARFGGDDVRCADYALFGTSELSQTIGRAMAGRNACLMANHGAVVCAEDVSAAVTLAVELEYLSELYWRALQGGAPVLLTPAEMAAVGERYRNYCRAGANPRPELLAKTTQPARGFRHDGSRRHRLNQYRPGGIRATKLRGFHPAQVLRPSGLPPLDTQHIYKLVAAADWQQAAHEGAWRGSADDVRDGYIHLSCADQVAGTLGKYFAQAHDLLLLAIDPADLRTDLRFEPSRGGALFPHLYAPLAVNSARLLARRRRPDCAWQLIDT
ncbi:MAG TPA: DUF952 domain-containing protein [Xanthomonadales bacterium]|nr:DUF952 domain-containing protein [Xanthomonadales bacterium]